MGISVNLEGREAYLRNHKSTWESIGIPGKLQEYLVTRWAGKLTWAVTGIFGNLQEYPQEHLCNFEVWKDFSNSFSEEVRTPAKACLGKTVWKIHCFFGIEAHFKNSDLRHTDVYVWWRSLRIFFGGARSAYMIYIVCMCVYRYKGKSGSKTNLHIILVNSFSITQINSNCYASGEATVALPVLYDQRITFLFFRDYI